MPLKDWFPAIAALAAWVGIALNVRSLRRSQSRMDEEDLDRAINKAVDVALLRHQQSFMDQFQSIAYCERIHKEQEKFHSRFDEEINNIRCWRNRLSQILIAVILFIQNEHRDSPLSPTLGKAVEALRGDER